MRIELCPFCGGKAKPSFKQCDYMGQNVYGDVKVKYRVQVICNKCHARGKPIKTDWIINPNPRKHPEEFTAYVDQAVHSWNEWMYRWDWIRDLQQTVAAFTTSSDMTLTPLIVRSEDNEENPLPV